MASISLTLATFNQGDEALSISYDDVSLLIQSVTFVNNSPTGHVTVTIADPTTHVALFGTPTTVAPTSGTTTRDISGLNKHMVQRTNIHGVATIGFPYEITASWSPS